MTSARGRHSRPRNLRRSSGLERPNPSRSRAGRLPLRKAARSRPRPTNSAWVAAPPVTTVERFQAIDQFRFAPPNPVVTRQSGVQWFFTGALAGCAVGLLLVMAVLWWRWSPAPLQTTQAPAAVVADAQASPPARPDVVRTAADNTREAIDRTGADRTEPKGSQSAGTRRSPREVGSRTSAGEGSRPEGLRQKDRSADRPAAHARPAETVKPKPSVRGHASHA